MKRTFWLSTLFFFFTVNIIAQEDAEGCKDHPLFSRMPNFYLYECSENYAALDLHIGPEKVQTHEGNRTHIDYRFNEGKNPSWLQVTRNYENAITKLGGKKIYSNDEYASYQLSRNEKDIYVQLQYALGDNLNVIQYALDVLEKRP